MAIFTVTRFLPVNYFWVVWLIGDFLCQPSYTITEKETQWTLQKKINAHWDNKFRKTVQLNRKTCKIECRRFSNLSWYECKTGHSHFRYLNILGNLRLLRNILFCFCQNVLSALIVSLIGFSLCIKIMGQSHWNSH